MLEDIRRLNAAGLNDSKIAKALGIQLHIVKSRRASSGIPAVTRTWPETVPLRERFWGHVVPEPNSGCWLWDGATNKYGYGVVKRGGSRGTMPATHASLMLSGRPVPAGLFACHHCDNPPCVNPDHLFVGTHQDNTRDMMAKGRSCRGERNGSAKLTAEIVGSIRAEAAAGKRGVQARIAERLGLSNQHISEIVRGLVWADSNRDGTVRS